MSYPLQSEPFSINCIVFTLTPHRFLKYTHTKQSFRPDDQQQVSDLVQRSILGNLMPEAMICFLENYGGSVYVCVLYVCISMFQGLINSLRFSLENSTLLRPSGAVRWGGCVCVIAVVDQPRLFYIVQEDDDWEDCWTHCRVFTKTSEQHKIAIPVLCHTSHCIPTIRERTFL